jgi:hypothetical protein
VGSKYLTIHSADEPAFGVAILSSPDNFFGAAFPWTALGGATANFARADTGETAC